MKRLATWSLAAALLATTAAFAQIAPSSSAPVDVTADELEVRQGDCLAIWRGRAEALQDQSRLRADTLQIFNKKGAGGGSCGALDRMDAQGNVFYVTPTQRVRGDRAVYTAGSDTITITGNVIVVQGENTVRGQRLVIKVATGEATFTGEGGASGRVRGVFYPNQASPKSRS